MSVASYSQASAVYDRSTDHAHHPAKDQPPSYDMATGPQVEGRKSAGDTPPVKALRNGVSGVVLFAGRGNEDRNVKWLPRDDERKSAGDAPRAGAPGNAVGSQKVAPAPEVAANLPSAAALKRQIAQFVEKNLGKDAKKAAQIASRIPTNDQVKLNNILENLKLIKGDNGDHFNSLKEYMSFAAGKVYSGVAMAQTTSDQRLSLRGLMLFMFSGIEPELYGSDDIHGRHYSSNIGGALSSCAVGIKKLDIQNLKQKLANADAVHYPTLDTYVVETLPVVIEQLRKIKSP